MDRKLDQLLFFLIENMTVVVSGEKMARDLDVSHSTVVRWVEKLRAERVEIKGEPFTGYRLLRLPDVLLPQLIRSRLRTETFGKALYHFFRVDSTNAFANRLLTHEKQAPHGAVIVAETQTAGRGRMGRSWYSEPESGLYVSVLLRPGIPSNLAPLMTLGAAVSVHDAIERQTELDVDIKWPNDLLIRDKKVCGILGEMQAEVDLVKAMVVGVGVNVNHQQLPDDIRDRATSLRLESGRKQSRIEILVDFLEDFENLYHRFKAKGPTVIIDQWTRRSSFAKGRKIEVNDGMRTIRGVTCGLNPLGALRIEQDNGEIAEAFSGDVARWDCL